MPTSAHELPHEPPGEIPAEILAEIPAGDVPGRELTDNWSGHRDRTRRAIVQAFLEMLVTENPTTISMPAVARRAGVSTRTLYRYFPNKDALAHAASTNLDDDIRSAIGGEPTVDNIVDYLRELWTALAANVPGVWAQQTNPMGRDLRRRRLDLRRKMLVERLGAELSDEHRDATIDLIIAIMSSSMMLELVDRMGHSPGRAAELAGRLVQLVIDDATEPPPSRPSSSTSQPTTRPGGSP